MKTLKRAPQPPSSYSAETKMEHDHWPARDFLGCGGSSPLPPRVVPSPEPKRPSSGAALTLAHLCCLVGLTIAAGFSARSQSYSIDWFTIDGGGGASTGGVYSVTGTIGQADAGTMTGGPYTLSGGFWGAIAAVQTPGAPYLWATLTPTNTALIWWARSPTSWRLQATTNLLPSGSFWTECSYQTNGANCYRLESPPSGRRFYRLQSP